MTGGQAIHVPFGACADLTNAEKAELASIDEKLAIKIVGGDAATSCETVLSFVQGKLARKVTRSGALPQDIREETSFSSPD